MSMLWQSTDKARGHKAAPLFNKILPLLIQPTLEDQERHLLMKVIAQVLYKLDEQPLINEDYYARVVGREIVHSNCSLLC